MCKYAIALLQKRERCPCKRSAFNSITIFVMLFSREKECLFDSFYFSAPENDKNQRDLSLCMLKALNLLKVLSVTAVVVPNGVVGSW